MIGNFSFARVFLSFSIIITSLLFVGCSGGIQKNGRNFSSDTAKYTNALIHETSPYLLQHAHNPVNWMPWGDDVFEKAQAENKLVLISVGYSSCHWCHVMEHESFEDEAVAELMNEKFICVKVDREERPDVDQVYMNAVQFMTNGNGGWPLNCFTLPDGRPIQGGTYYAKNQWIELLNNLAYNYEKSPERLEQYAQNVTNRIQQSELVEMAAEGVQFSPLILDTLIENWRPYFDKSDGGDQRNNKFPLPNNLDFLMQYAFHENDSAVMNHVDLTLEKMALGGIYDQIGGGFSRYSTDQKWKVPHFEKMLYDNAQLISLYSHAFQRTKNPLYKHVVYQTIEWAYREMMTPEGSFYSALDADSEGEEGKFYVWSKEGLKESLSEDDYKFAEKYYNIGVKSLWEGNHILLRSENNLNYSIKEGLGLGVVEESINRINSTLLEKRSERVRPGLDDKSLTSWNALMQIALVDAYSVFDEKIFLKAAQKNANWLLKRQLKSDGALLHTYKNGTSKIDGFLDDYSFSIISLIKLYEATFDPSYLESADKIAAYALKHFYDDKSGMFYYSSDTEGKLIARKMEIADNVIPSSNSAMANALLDLGILLDKIDYKNKAKKMLLNVSYDMSQYGSNYSNWGIIALNISHPYYEVAITGKDYLNILNGMNDYYIPNRLFMGAESESQLAILENKFMGETTIFVCIEGMCKMPTNTLIEALDQMK